MGGYGSGWQRATTATVEGSVVLTAASLVQKRALRAGARTSGSLGWTNGGEDEPHATVGYEATSWTRTTHGSGFTIDGTASRWTTGSGS